MLRNPIYAGLEQSSPPKVKTPQWLRHHRLHSVLIRKVFIWSLNP